MNIHDVRYTTAAQDTVLVVTSKGLLVSPWPTSEPLGDQVQAWLDAGNSIAPAPQTALEAARSKKLFEINRAYDTEIGLILASYPKEEARSFDKQESEARAWLTDSTAPTPYIDAMRLERDYLSKQELVDRIIAKADQFAYAHGLATGKRQRLEDAVNDATTVETVQAIAW